MKFDGKYLCEITVLSKTDKNTWDMRWANLKCVYVMSQQIFEGSEQCENYRIKKDNSEASFNVYRISKCMVDKVQTWFWNLTAQHIHQTGGMLFYFRLWAISSTIQCRYKQDSHSFKLNLTFSKLIKHHVNILSLLSILHLADTGWQEICCEVQLTIFFLPVCHGSGRTVCCTEAWEAEHLYRYRTGVPCSSRLLHW